MQIIVLATQTNTEIAILIMLLLTNVDIINIRAQHAIINNICKANPWNNASPLVDNIPLPSTCDN